MYIYPDNLKAKATMWLWSLKDLAIVGIIILFSVFAFAYAGVWFPLVIAGAYPVETLKYSDIIISALAVMVCVLFSILLIDCWVESMIVARASCDNP